MSHEAFIRSELFTFHPCGFYPHCGFTKNTHDVFILPMCTMWHQRVPKIICDDQLTVYWKAWAVWPGPLGYLHMSRKMQMSPLSAALDLDSSSHLKLGSSWRSTKTLPNRHIIHPMRIYCFFQEVRSYTKKHIFFHGRGNAIQTKPVEIRLKVSLPFAKVLNS